MLSWRLPQMLGRFYQHLTIKSYQTPKGWASNLHCDAGCETPWWVMSPRQWHSVDSVTLCTLTRSERQATMNLHLEM